MTKLTHDEMREAWLETLEVGGKFRATITRSSLGIKRVSSTWIPLYRRSEWSDEVIAWVDEMRSRYLEGR